MKWYSSVMDIPELEKLPPLRVRKIFLKYYWQFFWHWRHWVGIILFLVLIRLYGHWIIIVTDGITSFLTRLTVIIILTSFFMGISAVVYAGILLNGLAKKLRDPNNIK